MATSVCICTINIYQFPPIDIDNKNVGLFPKLSIYQQVWSNNIQDNSEEIAKKAFLELEQHKSKIEETKASLLSYAQKLNEAQKETDVKDLLALGEEAITKEPTTSNVKKKTISKKKKEDSDSELEDWEEVKGMSTFI